MRPDFSLNPLTTHPLSPFHSYNQHLDSKEHKDAVKAMAGASISAEAEDVSETTGVTTVATAEEAEAIAAARAVTGDTLQRTLRGSMPVILKRKAVRRHVRRRRSNKKGTKMRDPLRPWARACASSATARRRASRRTVPTCCETTVSDHFVLHSSLLLLLLMKHTPAERKVEYGSLRRIWQRALQLLYKYPLSVLVPVVGVGKRGVY